MKTARGWAATMLLLATFAARAVANPVPSQTDPTDNPRSLADPDGVPLSVSQPKPIQAAVDDAQAKQSKQDDWLMKIYQDSLKKRLGTSGTDADDPQPANDKSTSSLRTGSTTTGKPALTLRPDSTNRSSLSVSQTQSPTAPKTFKPLITPLIKPLSATDAAGLPGFYSSIPTSPQTVAAPTRTGSPLTDSTPSFLDTPGLTAAESNPLKRSTLSFDISSDDQLPQDSTPSSAPRALPVTTDIGQLQQADASKLAPPGSPPKLIKPIPINPTAIKVPDDLAPGRATPPITGHSPIADPHNTYFH